MTTYQPKGSMCCSCYNKNADCSGLDFRSMRPMKIAGDVVIVKCEKWERDSLPPVTA